MSSSINTGRAAAGSSSSSSRAAASPTFATSFHNSSIAEVCALADALLQKAESSGVAASVRPALPSGARPVVPMSSSSLAQPGASSEPSLAAQRFAFPSPPREPPPSAAGGGGAGMRQQHQQHHQPPSTVRFLAASTMNTNATTTASRSQRAASWSTSRTTPAMQCRAFCNYFHFPAAESDEVIDRFFVLAGQKNDGESATATVDALMAMLDASAAAATAETAKMVDANRGAPVVGHGVYREATRFLLSALCDLATDAANFEAPMATAGAATTPAAAGVGRTTPTQAVLVPAPAAFRFRANSAFMVSDGSLQVNAGAAHWGPVTAEERRRSVATKSLIRSLRVAPSPMGSLHGSANGSAGARSPVAGVPLQLTSEVASIPSSSLSDSGVIRRTSTAFFNKAAVTKEEEDGCYSVNQHVVLMALGSGSQGEVFLAMDTQCNELRAIKVIRRPVMAGAGAAAMMRWKQQWSLLQKEIAIMKHCRHRNIVALYEVIDDPEADAMYLVMQYVDKGPIAKLLPDGTLPQPFANRRQLAHFAVQVLKGLRYLHRNGVVHRDIKPDNILVDSSGTALLADFGVSELFLGLEQEAAGAGGPRQVSGTRGTHAFIAPELLAIAETDATSGSAGDAALDRSRSLSQSTSTTSRGSSAAAAHLVNGAAVDVWALGITLYTLLRGRIPWDAMNTTELFAEIASAHIDVRAAVGQARTGPARAAAAAAAESLRSCPSSSSDDDPKPGFFISVDVATSPGIHPSEGSRGGLPLGLHAHSMTASSMGSMSMDPLGRTSGPSEQVEQHAGRALPTEASSSPYAAAAAIPEQEEEEQQQGMDLLPIPRVLVTTSSSSSLLDRSGSSDPTAAASARTAAAAASAAAAQARPRPPPSKPAIDPDDLWVALLAGMLERDPNRRWSVAQALSFAEQLRDTPALPIAAAPPPAPPRGRAGPRGRPCAPTMIDVTAPTPGGLVGATMGDDMDGNDRSGIDFDASAVAAGVGGAITLVDFFNRVG